VPKQNIMKEFRGTEVKINAFLTLTLSTDELRTSRFDVFTSGKVLFIHLCEVGWDTEEIWA